MNTPARRGPVEDGSWPTQLDAHVVDPGPPLRIHGYAALGDLARHHSPAEIALLAYTGELPEPRALRSYELALALLAPVAVTSAAAHGAVLARLLAAPDANVVAIAAMLAADHAQHTIGEHAAWLAWCTAPTGSPPAEFLTPDGETTTLDDCLRARSLTIDNLAGRRPTSLATALALLVAAGIREPLLLVAVIAHAGLPCMIAEAQRHTPGRMPQYPIGFPAFDYREDADD